MLNFLRSKKGDEALGAGTLAVIVIIAASAIVLLLFSLKVSTSGIFGETDRQLCRNSLWSQGIAKNIDEDIIDPKCSTYNLKFYEKKVELNGKTIPVINPETGSQKKSFEKLNDETVNAVVAEQMRLCWWQFWEGKKSILSSEAFLPAAGDNCFICNEITFDRDISQSEFKGYYEYIKNTKMPTAEMTYYEYLAESSRIIIPQLYDKTDNPKNAWEEYADGIDTGWNGFDAFFSTSCLDMKIQVGNRLAVKRDIVFEKDKPYAIVFVKEGTTRKSVLRVVGGAPNPTVDNQACSQENYFTYIISTDEIKNQCDSISRGTVS